MQDPEKTFSDLRRLSLLPPVSEWSDTLNHRAPPWTLGNGVMSGGFIDNLSTDGHHAAI